MRTSASLAAIGGLLLAMTGTAAAADMAEGYAEQGYGHRHARVHGHHHHRRYHAAGWYAAPEPEPVISYARPSPQYYCEHYVPRGVLYNAPRVPRYGEYGTGEVITARY